MNPNPNMKTMLELLIRLTEMRRSCQRTEANAQLTDTEKAAASAFKQLVRECLPPAVLVTYDALKKTEPELLESPEVFAMAVLADTYRQSSLAERRHLVAHFAAPPHGVATVVKLNGKRRFVRCIPSR